MFWDWRHGRPVIRAIETTDPQINLYQGSVQSSTPVTIRRQSLETASRILGVHQSPLGDFSEHIKVLKQKADKYAAAI